MRKRTKQRIRKTAVTVVLLLAVIIVQVAEGFALDAQAASEPSVVVNDFSGLYSAIIQARDGDIIGISDVISITANNVTVGDLNKHITIVRMSEGAFLDIASNKATIQNITFDGNGLDGYYSMCVANYHTDFNNVTFQDCKHNMWDGCGGAISGFNGNINLTGCTFINNEAVNGGHAYFQNDVTLNIDGCTFTGGHASTDGGGLYIQTSKQNTISNSTLTGNSADRIGGGILNQSALTITDSKVYSNTAAIGGADIANRSGFNLMVEHDMDALAPLFADLNLNPVEWVNDFDDEAGVTIEGFEPTVENTFLKLTLEAITAEEPDNPDEPGDSGEDPENPGEGGNTGGESGGQEEPGTGEGGSEGGTGGESSGTGENTGDGEGTGADSGEGGTETPGDDSGSGQGGSDDSGQGDSSEGQGTDPGSTEGGNDSTTDPTEDPGSGSSDEGSDNTPSDSESGQGSSDAPGTDTGTGTGTEADDGSGQASDASGNTTTDNSSVTGDTTTDSNNTANTTDRHDTSAVDSHDSSTHSDSHDSTTENHSSDNSRTDNSRSSTTNDSHDSSVVNNYYSSENPSAPAPQTQVVASSQPPQVTVVNNIPSAEGQRSSSGQEQPQQQNQVQQSTDNIRIEANGVNVVYEVIDGVHSISINANVQKASEPVFQQLATEAASAPSAENQMVNWYEIAKVILLAGILVNLMWKRKEKD